MKKRLAEEQAELALRQAEAAKNKEQLEKALQEHNDQRVNAEVPCCDVLC
jgi:hypothetical protein